MSQIKSNQEIILELENLMLNMSPIRELPEAMCRIFLFLSKYFPIEGIILHRIIPELSAIHYDCLITGAGFHPIDRTTKLNPNELEYLLDHQQGGDIRSGLPSSDNVANKVNREFFAFLEPKERRYTAIILRIQNKIIGHIALIGKNADLFSENQFELLDNMHNQLSIFILNLLEYNEMRKIALRLDHEKAELENELHLLKQNPFVTTNRQMQFIMKTVEQFARSDAPVLIMGETGTGKEVIADIIQAKSLINRRNIGHSPYIKINCGAIPDSLIESELFGYAKGSFTGATNDKAGKFEEANNGTLFLDEIGELSLDSQTRLLRVLQDGAVQRLGSNQTLKVNVRVVAATNRNLEDMVKLGTFRKDLYFRLNVFPIYLPPLRDRTDDIPLLIKHFITLISHKLSIYSKIEVSKETIKALTNYSWPGNVRELKNIVERAITLEQSSPLNLLDYLQEEDNYATVQNQDRKKQENLEQLDLKKMIQEEVLEALNLQNTNKEQVEDSLYLDDIIRNHIIKVLKKCRYKINGKNGAAEVLNINPSTLRKKMQKLGIKIDYSI